MHTDTPTSSVVNERGQGLVEYLIVVALMAVASIAVVRTLGQVVQTRFAFVAAGLQGDKHPSKVRIDPSVHKRKNMGNFFDGVDGGSGAGSDSGGGDGN